jgi:hypothetical protein
MDTMTDDDKNIYKERIPHLSIPKNVVWKVEYSCVGGIIII